MYDRFEQSDIRQNTVNKIIVSMCLALALSGCITVEREVPAKPAAGSGSEIYGLPVTRTLPEAAD